MQTIPMDRLRRTTSDVVGLPASLPEGRFMPLEPGLQDLIQVPISCSLLFRIAILSKPFRIGEYVRAEKTILRWIW